MSYTDHIVYLEGDSKDLRDLKAAVDWCVENDRHLRIEVESTGTDRAEMKFKAGEGGWTPPIQSHQPHGGYPSNNG